MNQQVPEHEKIIDNAIQAERSGVPVNWRDVTMIYQQNVQRVIANLIQRIPQPDPDEPEERDPRGGSDDT